MDPPIEIDNHVQRRRRVQIQVAGTRKCHVHYDERAFPQFERTTFTKIEDRDLEAGAATKTGPLGKTG